MILEYVARETMEEKMCKFCGAPITWCATMEIAATCEVGGSFKRLGVAIGQRDAAFSALEAHGITDGLPDHRAARVEARRRGDDD